MSPAKVGESFALIERLPALDVSVLVIEQRATVFGDLRLPFTMAGTASELLANEHAAEMFAVRL